MTSSSIVVAWVRLPSSSTSATDVTLSQIIWPFLRKQRFSNR